MKAKKGNSLKKRSSNISNKLSSSSKLKKFSNLSNSNKSKDKSKSKSKSLNRSRKNSQNKLKNTSQSNKNQGSLTIKSSIFTSESIKIGTKDQNNPIIAQNIKKKEMKSFNKKAGKQNTQSQNISSPNQINDNLNQNSKVPEEIPVSQEGYKNKAITDNFKDIPSYLDEPNDLSLFDKKEETENNLETNKYNIENLLLMDQTNKKLQKKYLAIAIELLNFEKDPNKIEILKEKIKKSGIILDEDNYKEEINRIRISDFVQNFDYINYRKIFFETLKYILKSESNLIDAKNKLKIEKIYLFNQPAELGNNNYYFYELCLELRNKIDEIFMRYNLYTQFIPYFLEFIEEKNLDNLTKNEKFLFKYLLELLLDKRTINNQDQLDKVMDFLNGEKVIEKEVIEAVKSSKTHNKLNMSKIPAINYELDYNKKLKKLNLLIKDNRKLCRKMHCFNKKYSYKIDNFNKKIIKIIAKEFDFNIESKLFENVLPNEDNINELLSDIRSEFNRIIKKILSSKAATNFFNDHYKAKYKNLNYHLNRERVQEEILKRISFVPIFNGKDNAVTSPTDLSIIINCIPGIFDSENISIFNRKILILGQYILFGIHEILGHYCRRYYSYFTGQQIKINTKEDNEIQTGNERGDYAEKEFIGISNKCCLTIREALALLYWEKYDSYPIIAKNSQFELNEEKIEIIINKNKNIFYFIKINDNVKDEETITIKEYLELISYSSNSFQSNIYTRIHCPFNYDEDYIYWHH